jgi:hypothetical protein
LRSGRCASTGPVMTRSPITTAANVGRASPPDPGRQLSPHLGAPVGGAVIRHSTFAPPSPLYTTPSSPRPTLDHESQRRLRRQLLVEPAPTPASCSARHSSPATMKVSTSSGPSATPAKWRNVPTRRERQFIATCVRRCPVCQFSHRTGPPARQVGSARAGCPVCIPSREEMRGARSGDAVHREPEPPEGVVDRCARTRAQVSYPLRAERYCASSLHPVGDVYTYGGAPHRGGH